MEKEILHDCPVLASYEVYCEWETDLMSNFRLHSIASIVEGTEPRPLPPASVTSGPVTRSQEKKSSCVPGTPAESEAKPRHLRQRCLMMQQ